jgi:hypothetical protein
MTLMTKHCNGCGEDKLLDEFNFHKTGRRAGTPLSKCRECYKIFYGKLRKQDPKKYNAMSRDWKKANPERTKELSREYTYRHGAKPALENKSCSSYLGCVIAETVLSHEFPGFRRMPNGNPGYDYECPKGFKIDVKSGCRTHNKDANDNWRFNIKKNKVPDYFLCIAFDNRKSLNPEHIWLIPGNMINDKIGFGITATSKGIDKWFQYERSLDNVLKCCNKMR